MADNYVENVEDHLSVGDEVEVKVLSLLMTVKLVYRLKAKDRPRKPHHNNKI